MERRSYQIRQEPDAEKIRGHAAVFNEWADIGGMFQERVAPGAFAEAMGDDVRALFNHDSNYVLGRTRSGTLRIAEDSRGLAIEADPPDTQWARDLVVSMKRGDIDQMSFGFRVLEDSWDHTDPNMPRRTILRVALVDVSVVTYPAYEGTDAAVRAARDTEEHERAAKRAARAKRLWDLTKGRTQWTN